MEEGKQILRLIQCVSVINGYPHKPNFKSKTTELVLARADVNSDELILSIIAKGQSYSFYYGDDENRLNLLYENADGRVINPEYLDGMVGTILGMFASSNNIECENYTVFDWFEYEGSDDVGVEYKN
jgi:xylan 1,4-beta-xylosidase